MLDFEIDFPQNYEQLIKQATEQQRHEISSNLAHELNKELQIPHRTVWPVDTSHSVRRFLVEDDSATNDILVLNTAKYARYVNAKGKHRGAAQKAIQQLWARALRRVI